jgi:hypothetical protein
MKIQTDTGIVDIPQEHIVEIGHHRGRIYVMTDTDVQVAGKEIIDDDDLLKTPDYYGNKIRKIMGIKDGVDGHPGENCTDNPKMNNTVGRMILKACDQIERDINEPDKIYIHTSRLRGLINLYIREQEGADAVQK